RPNHFLTHCPSLHLIPHSVPTRRSSDLLATRGDRHYWQTLPGSERGNVSRYALLVSAFALLPLAANAQELPARTIRIIVPSPPGDRKSTRLNSSHVSISYAVFCLKKKT